MLIVVLGCTSPTPGTDASLDAGVDDATFDDATLDVMDGFDADMVDATRDAATPLRVLFVGNSYTYQNDLPRVVRALADASAVDIETDIIAEGGATLWNHHADGEVAARIAEGDLDFVVLQGQSSEPILAGLGFQIASEALAEVLAEHEARGIWFATWPRRPGHDFYDRPQVADAEHMNSILETYYNTAAWQNREFLARVGGAWLIALDELPEVDLYEADGSHPSAAGSLLAACVLVQGLTGVSPTVPDPVPLDVARDDAERLCALAERVQCREGWDFCDARCVTVNNDHEHCGACDNLCLGEEPCREGVCGCPDGLTPCSRGCQDIQTSVRNCGGCGVACERGETCAAGSCDCLPYERQDTSAVVADAPECSGFANFGSIECRTRAATVCAEQGCFGSGVGPFLAPGHGHSILCFGDESAAVSYATLSMFDSRCSADGDCAFAAHRHCVAMGSSGGVASPGDADAAIVSCLTEASVVRVPIEELMFPFEACDGTSRWECAANSWRTCEAMGFAAGYGPVDQAGDEVDILCFE